MGLPHLAPGSCGRSASATALDRSSDAVRVLALALLVTVAVALLVFQWWSLRRHWLPQMTRPAQGWLWEQPWHRQVLVWGSLVVGLTVAVVLAIKVPPDGEWNQAFRAVLLAPAVIAAFLQGRRNRREGIGAPPPFMRHGPPGWTWDGESATWRPPE